MWQLGSRHKCELSPTPIVGGRGYGGGALLYVFAFGLTHSIKMSQHHDMDTREDHLTIKPSLTDTCKRDVICASLYFID